MKIKLISLMLILSILLSTFTAFPAFANTDANEIFKYFISNETVTITSCNSDASGEIIIPDTIGGYPVTTLDTYSFSYCGNITSVYIPSSVTIMDFAFRDCKSLTSVTLEEGIATIGTHAFFNCNNLKSIDIPDSVTEIGSYAFGMTGLERIEFSKNIELIDYKAFGCCRNLKEINVDEENTNYASVDGNLFDKSKTILYQYSSGKTDEAYTIPDGVEIIEEYALGYIDNLVNLTIPVSLTTISDSAFYASEKLSNIYYKGSLEQWDTITGYNENLNIYCNGELAIPKKEFEVENGVIIEYLGSSNEIVIPDSIAGEEIVAIGNDVFSYNNENILSVSFGTNIRSIGNNAFNSCINLNSIVLPSSLESIGTGAFANCSKLQNVLIPESVKTIGNNAFSNCEQLEAINVDSNNQFYSSIDGVLYSKDTTTVIQFPKAKGGVYTINDKTKRIEYGAFSNTNIEKLVLGDNLEYIGSYAFQGCEYLKHLELPDSIKEIGSFAFSNSAIEKIILPESISEIPDRCFNWCRFLQEIDIPQNITKIGNNAFYNCDSLKAISIPDSVTELGGNVFEDCDNLYDVNLGNGVTYLSDYIFKNCNSLVNISIPNGIATIGTSAFYYCSSLTNIAIPKTITKIKQQAFYLCNNLVNVSYSGDVTDWSKISFEYGNDKIKKANISYIGMTGDDAGANISWELSEEGVLILSGEGEMYNFECEEMVPWYHIKSFIKKVELADGIVSIGDYAFANCSNLQRVVISDKLIRIGKCAFSNCKYVNIELPEYIYNTRPEWSVFPNSLTDIEQDAFSGCVYPKAITYMGFEEEWNNIEISEGNTTITNAVFKCKTPLTESVYYLLIDELLLIDGNGAMPDEDFPWEKLLYSPNYHLSVDNIEFGEGITYIAPKFWKYSENGAGYYNGMYIESISVADNNSYYSVIDDVLYDKNLLKLVAFPCGKAIDSFTIPDGITEICDYAFFYNKYLKHITMPISVTHIGDSAFSIIQTLESIDFSPNITTIDDAAFSGCYNLKKVSLPEKLTSIGWNAFWGCGLLTEVRIPDNVLSISPYAFECCEKLSTVTFSNNIKTIGGSAFNSCSIKKISIPSTTTYIGDGAFNCSTLETITVDTGNTVYGTYDGALYNKVDNYFVQYPTAKTDEIYRIPNGIEQIGYSAFNGNTYIKKVIIPDTVEHILGMQYGERAFSGCTNLTDVIFEGEKVSVGDYVFAGCSRLNNINLKKISSIGEGAFLGCSSLKHIDLTGKTSISKNSFANCDGLTYITIPDGVRYIYEGAFAGCDNLKNVSIGKNVSTINSGVFRNCPLLRYISVSDENTKFDSLNGDLYEGKVLIQYATGKENKEYTISEHCSRIGKRAFEGAKISTLTIPATVTSILDYAFINCNDLTNVVFLGTEEEWNKIAIGSGNECLLNANITYAYDLIRFKVEGYDFTRFGGVWNVPNATVTCNGVSKTTDSNGVVTFSCEEVGYVDNGDYSFVSYEVECDGYFSKSNSRCYRPNQYIHTVSLLARDASRIYPQNIVLHGAIPNKLGDSRTVYTQDMPYHWTNEIRMDKQLNRSYRMDLTIDWNGYEPGNVYLQNNETGKQLAFINNSLTFNPKFDLDVGNDYSIVAYSSDGSVSAATKIYFSVSGIPSKLTDVDYTINHKGKAFVRINLQNAQGGVPSNKNIQYSFEGYDGVYEGTTDASGTIVVETPVLSGKNETKQLTVIFNDDTLEKSTYAFDVFISDLSYSQSWKGKVGAGVGAELSFGVDGSIGVAEGEAKLASIGVEGKAAKTLCIETEYNNGKQRIKLSTSADAAIAEKLSAGIFAGIGTPTEMAELSVGKVYGEVEAGTGKEIALVIDDFNPNNSEHLKQIAMFLLDCSLSLDKNTTNVILQKLLNHLLNDGNDVYNEQYTNKSAKLGAGAKAGFFEVGDFEVTLLGASGETFYQHKSGTDANDNTVYSTELTADAGVDIGEVKMNETNIGSENLLSFDWLNNSVELKTTIDPSDIVNYGVKDISIKSLIDSDKHSILWGTQKNSTYSTLTFDEEEAKGLTMKVNNLDRFLNNKRWLFSTNEFCQMVNDAVNSGNSADYTKTKTKENGFNASYNFGLTALAGAEVGFTISAIDSTEYVTQNGIMENGVIYKTSESYISDSEAKSGIDTIISLAIDYLAEIAKDYFVNKAGGLSEGVDLDKAKVEKVTSSLIDVGTEIIKIKASEISPFSLLSVEEENDGIDASYRTKTIGESYVVNFKDSNGNYVDELDGVAKLTLSYDLSDLENSGISSEQTDLNSMSIYKWNETKNVYTRVGSTVDIENCSVSAEISGSGEYVLAIDDEAPTVTDITVLNNSQNPIISAIISDASGLNEFTLQLDDNLVVDENSFYDYYDSKTSLFRYTCSTTLTDGVHVAIFNTVDDTGNKMEPIYYTFTVDTSSPIINSVTIPETSESTTIAIEANVSDENISRVLAVMECIDTTYTYEMDNNGGFWTVNVENLPEFAVLKTYIMAYDSFGNESKSDIYETIIAKNSGDEISIGIISVDGKDIVVGINNKLEDTNSCIYVAGYSSQGELEEIKTIDVTEIGVMLKPVKMDELHDTYKVFCWESLNTLKPLSDYSEYFKFYN